MKRRDSLVWLSGAALAALSRPASGEPAHPGLRVSLGPASVPHAMPGGDARRSRRAATVLSATPRVERRLRVALGIGRGLVTRADGSFFVVHPSARASSFDGQGKLLFSSKLPAEAGSPPVVTSSGHIALLAGGDLFTLDERGRVRSRTPIGDPELAARGMLGTRDGGVLLAGAGSLFKLSAFGELEWRRSPPEPALDLLETQVGLVCVSSLGSVQRLDANGRVIKLGELGGAPVTVTASVSGTELLARTGSHRLASFDLRLRRLRASVEDATLQLDGPVLLSNEGMAQVFTSDGLLVRYRSDGSEAQRVPVDPGSRKGPGLDDALLLGDGRLLLARQSADAVLVTPSGEVTSIAGSACPDPIGVFAAGPRTILLACRSGNMLVLS